MQPGPADLNSPDIYALSLVAGFKVQCWLVVCGITHVCAQQAPNFTLNNVAFNPPTVPVLLQILSGQHSAQSLLPTGSVYTLPSNTVCG
jgi:hypothetical protein